MKVAGNQLSIKRGNITSFYSEKTIKMALGIFEDVVEALKENQNNVTVLELWQNNLPKKSGLIQIGIHIHDGFDGDKYPLTKIEKIRRWLKLHILQKFLKKM